MIPTQPTPEEKIRAAMGNEKLRPIAIGKRSGVDMKTIHQFLIDECTCHQKSGHAERWSLK